MLFEADWLIGEQVCGVLTAGVGDRCTAVRGESKAPHAVVFFCFVNAMWLSYSAV